MKTVFRAMLVLPLLALALGAAGCGSSSGLPTGASPVAGATIQGTVNPSAGAASEGVRGFSTSGASLRVTVVGTSLSTTTDASGRFTIQGVPSGSVVLRFQGSGVDATVRIEGLVDGQVLTITVHVNGSQATLETSPTRQQEVEFTGAIESISPPELRVAGRRVVTSPRTEIKRGNAKIALSALQVGESVKVEGVQQSDGSVLADEIKAGTTIGAREVELKGVIESISAPRFQVSGRTVVTDANTGFKGNGRVKSLADLRVGDRVEVKGTEQSDGSVLAREVEREDDDDDDEAELEGLIESISPPDLRVAGRTVRTDASTKIERDDKRISLADLRVGERVEVKGVRQADGSILARKIEVEDDDD